MEHGSGTTRIDATINEWLNDCAALQKAIAVTPGGKLPSAATAEFLDNIPNANTRKAYYTVLRRFFAWVEANEVKDWLALPGKKFAQHIRGIDPRREKTKSTGIPGKTQMLAHTVICNYYDHLQFSGTIPSHNTRTFKPRGLSSHSNPTPALFPDEFRALFAAMPNITPVDKRNRALVALLAGTACRVGAALTLRHRALTCDRGVHYVTLNEKGGKKHEVKLSNAVMPALETYLSVSRADDPDMPVFRRWDRKLRCFTELPIAYLEAYRVVASAAKRAGIAKAITPHCLRATGITAALIAGVPMDRVQAIAGHADIATTRKYDRRIRVDANDDIDVLGRALTLEDA